MLRPLNDLDRQVLALLNEDLNHWVSSHIIAQRLRKKLITDGVINALVGLDLRGLAQQHPTIPWKFRITLAGTEICQPQVGRALVEGVPS